MNDEDHLLQAFVSLTENGLEFPVTLTVGGMLISGMLTSYSEYLKLLGEHMRAMTIPEHRDAMTEAFTNLAESAQDAARERRREEEAAEAVAEAFGEEPEDAVGPVYIHLKDARLFLASGIITQGNTLWRGKIAAVDGFILGAATPSH